MLAFSLLIRGAPPPVATPPKVLRGPACVLAPGARGRVRRGRTCDLITADVREPSVCFCASRRLGRVRRATKAAGELSNLQPRADRRCLPLPLPLPPPPPTGKLSGCRRVRTGGLR